MSSTSGAKSKGLWYHPGITRFVLGIILVLVLVIGAKRFRIDYDYEDEDE